MNNDIENIVPSQFSTCIPNKHALRDFCKIIIFLKFTWIVANKC